MLKDSQLCCWAAILGRARKNAAALRSIIIETGMSE
jgi:hypothetical protein